MLSVPYVAQLIEVVLRGMPFPQVGRAVPLLLGIAVQESGLQHTRQLGSGPARGYWQMEPATERAHWQMLRQQVSLEQELITRCGVEEASAQALQHNIPYQILMARLHFYLRDPLPLPERQDIQEQARRWKKYYNTEAGKGTVQGYLLTWERLIRPLWSA